MKRFKNNGAILQAITAVASILIGAAMLFSKEVSVASASKKALNTLNLTIRDENILRGIDYINMLVVAYNNYSTNEKHREVSRYDEYVKERLAKVDADLGVKDEDWESFKKQNKVMDLKVDAEEVIKKIIFVQELNQVI